MGKLSPILKKVNKALDMRAAARMKRAEEMGFYDNTLFHGTAAKPTTTMDDGNIFDEFKLWEGKDPTRSTVNSEVSKLGVSLAEQPAIAEDFANLASQNASDGSALLPLRFRADKVGSIDLQGDELNSDIYGSVVDSWRDGYDAIQFNNYTTPQGKKGSFVLVKDPSQIRSVNAAFDPAKKDGANLLAGLGGAGVTGGAILGSDESEAGAGSKIVQALVRGADDANLPDTGWRGGHTAPVDPEYHAPLHEINKTYPDDIYSPQAIRHYGHGDYAMDKESIGVIQRLRGRPDDEVDVFRAVPSDAPDEILPGDWVTLSENYARIHGEGRGDYKILKGRAKAKKLRTDGNSPHEFGYTGAVIPAAFGLGSMLTPEQAAAADSFAAQDNDGIYADEYPTLDRIGTALNKIEFPIIGKPLEGTGRYLQRFGEPRTKWQQLKDAYGAAFDFL